ncbi:hypothetical protein [Neptunomonas qingdaonensis]|uniref:PBP superfamily domain-containing protein n=1 Tax=Neptunomonas qingdaonensis TaxID=1045558 RepID=A0A1I2NUA4_9GAMM|nr:hypothetical protein [Neptunomonas qingdaonensis]SFG07474.1 hypothetical protein SAMN05216175_103128 [Neptunomonas qingdaonensis]
MTHKRRTYLAVFLLMMSQLAGADSVIVHPDVKVSSLSSQELRSIFTMRSTRWPDQNAIHVFVLPDSHPLHRSFVKTQLNMFPYQLRMIWDRSVYSGAGYPPILVPSIQEMLVRVKSTQSSIGYIDDNSLPLLKGVNIIEIR